MSCSSEKCCPGFSRFFLFLLALVVGGFVVASLPEIKRYIKISTM
jgi:hypothetical protein